MTTEPDVWRLGVGQLVAQYSKGVLSPVETVEALSARIEHLDPEVGAFTTLTLDRAMDEAKVLEKELAAGTTRGPLHGVPVGIKELFDVGGAETTYGSPALAGRVPEGDAEAVRRLRQAGCIVMGLTRSHEFGWGITTQNSVRGSTRNPWNLDRVPGGSSGGSAAALAMGFVPLALGSDTGGSIRIPAGYCGVAGFKPTYGRVSKRGAVALAPSLDHPGPLARHAADLIQAYAALAGYDVLDPTTLKGDGDFGDVDAGLDDLVVGLCPDLHIQPLSADHQRIFDEAVARLDRVKVVEVPFEDAAGIRSTFGVIQMAEAHHYHARELGLYPGRRAEYGTDVAQRLDMAADVTLSDYLDARLRALEYRRSFQRLFESVDVLVTPVVGGGPSTVGDPDRVFVDGEEIPFRDLVMDYTVPQDLGGLPACVVPTALDDDGLPVGIQVTAAHGQDSLALRGGMGLEGLAAREFGWPPAALSITTHE